jgi:hypothetical protein
MVVMVMMMVVVSRCKSRGREQHDRGEQQSLFHAPNHSNGGVVLTAASSYFWVTPIPE